MKAFLEYVEGVESDKPFVKKVVDEVGIVKSSGRLRGEYMNQVVRDHLNREDGRLEGDISRVTSLIIKKVQKSKPLEVIADELECTVAEIDHLYELIIQGGPECSVEDILEKVGKKS